MVISLLLISFETRRKLSQSFSLSFLHVDGKRTIMVLGGKNGKHQSLDRSWWLGAIIIVIIVMML